jgi:SAM-dependent methyltransferase
VRRSARPVPRTFRRLLRLLPILLLGAAPRPTLSPAPPDAALREIQNVCFAAYPSDLLQRMTGHAGPPPPEVQSDPRLQVKHLKTEAVVTKGLFYPSLLEELVPAFRAAIGPGTRFLDLGSGDGRVVFLAALMGADATGIEYDRELHGIAVRARRRLSHLIDRRRATLRRGDFFDLDLSRYDVLFYFGKGSFAEDRLGEKIVREMRPDAVLLLSYPVGPVSGLHEVGTFGFVTLYDKSVAARQDEP